MLGGHSSLDPPDPIPNSEVKRTCADDSVDYPCESRSPPGSLLRQTPSAYAAGGFAFIGAEKVKCGVAHLLASSRNHLPVAVSFILNICYNVRIVYGLSAHFLFVAEIWIYTVCWNPR